METLDKKKSFKTPLKPIIWTLNNYTVEKNEELIQKLGHSLMDGSLVAFPTETVYGLGANALSSDAVLRIFEAKKRPLCDPVICHVSSTEEAFKLISEKEHPLVLLVLKIFAEYFWPGPLSLVARASAVVPNQVMGGTSFVSVRCPNHPVALQLIRAARVPIAAPSANLFGRISPSLAIHVAKSFQNVELEAQEGQGIQRDLYILDAGRCSVGIESTVCKVTMTPEGTNLLIIVLRRGFVSTEMLRNALKSYLHNFKTTLTPEWYRLIETCEIHVNQKFDTLANSQQQSFPTSQTKLPVLHSPGTLLTHYAPTFPTFLLCKSSESQLTQTVEIQENQESHRLGLQHCILIDSFGLLKDIRKYVVHYFELTCDSEEQLDVGHVMQRNVFKVMHDAQNAATQILERDKTAEIFICITDFYRQIHDLGESAMAVYDRLFRSASGRKATLV